MNKILTSLFVVALAIAQPFAAMADKGNGGHNGNETPKAPKNVKFRVALLPASELADLTTSKGRLDFQSNKSVKQLTAQVKIPASTSLGIVDAATAARAQIHLEFSRLDTLSGASSVYADCTMKFDGDNDDTSDDKTSSAAFEFKLHVKNKGKEEVKGTCGGEIPAMQKGDSVEAYLLGTTRIDFMSGK